MSKKYEMDMTQDPLLKQIIIFAVPLILSSVLQLLFNAADIVVVGRFSGSESLAAVGSTTSLINLLVNLFLGLSIGTNVLFGRYIGAGDHKNASETLHTAIYIATFAGIGMIFVGNIFAKPLLTLMGTPDNVIDLASLYMRVYFIGMPGFMLYNFGSAILRTVGDTKRPLYYLTFAGIVNVILNLIFVLGFHMGVAGVAIATSSAECLSAFFIVRALVKSDGVLKLEKSKFKLHKDKLFKMLRIGLPAGLQGMIFNISNVLIQSSVNSFGSIVIAGNTSASNIEGFVYTSMNAIYQTSLSFTSQNMGAKNYKRVQEILLKCLGVVVCVGFCLGYGAYFFGEQLLGIYSQNAAVIQAGLIRMSFVSATYFLCGMMDVIVGSLRGMGYSIMPMIVSLVGACLFRVIWIFTIFKANHTLMTLYISYPISWIITFSAHVICYLLVRKRTFV